MFKNLVSVEQLKISEVMALIKQAQSFKETPPPKQTADLFACNLFFENSTRTHSSFEVAEKRLGLEVLSFDPEKSSVKKGETLYDTILTLGALGVKFAVIRHPEDAYYEELLAKQNQVAIINGGDGSGQHPTQCLLDLMTIFEEFGHFEGLKVAIVGDLSHSRVAKSNMQLLKKLGAKLYFSGPQSWFTDEFAHYGDYVAMDELVAQVDVLMLLRVQHERHTVLEDEAFSKETYHQQYGLTAERAKKMQQQAIIMHPAPVNRDVELADELVEAPQSRIVAQMHNGVFMRMAIIDTIIQARNWGTTHENINQTSASLTRREIKGYGRFTG